ncbi:MAG: hypothetical protein GXP60_02690 [Epsilonproteobacteria bacterium]|nr:hypothetical protein [Campylobacterota bacterium]
MELNTAAAVIDYISEIEKDSAEFYENCAERYNRLRDTFRSLAKEHVKIGKRVRMDYYSVVTDALGAGFGFQEFEAKVGIPALNDDASFSDAVEKAVKLENDIQQFYLKVIFALKPLMPDISRSVERVTKSMPLRVDRLNRI